MLPMNSEKQNQQSLQCKLNWRNTNKKNQSPYMTCKRNYDDEIYRNRSGQYSLSFSYSLVLQSYYSKIKTKCYEEKNGKIDNREKNNWTLIEYEAYHEAKNRQLYEYDTLQMGKESKVYCTQYQKKTKQKIQKRALIEQLLYLESFDILTMLHV